MRPMNGSTSTTEARLAATISRAEKLQARRDAWQILRLLGREPSRVVQGTGRLSHNRVA
jgi:hypothetical protein